MDKDLKIISFKIEIGWIELISNGKAITKISFRNHPNTFREPDDILAEAENQLQQYFAGERKVFDLPLDPSGTDFQKQVWNELLNIPYGRTTSYLDMARRLGDEKVIRAAASANGKNPIAIIIPCHRVIGSNGTLTGYAGGLHRKEWLLQHEQGVHVTDLFSHTSEKI